jgi:predicted phage terminase large subunit-like protein
MVVVETIIRPQPGPQYDFMASTADIVIYGGAAFGGKTFALLMECMRHKNRLGFDAVIFRRTYPQITASGGLWDTSMELYHKFGGSPKPGDNAWVWPSGHRVMFRHLQHEKDKFTWMGSAIPLLCFDELTHFTRGQFFYLLSRNRMYAGAPGRPYIRATCNPDTDSWVAEFIAWWVDQDTGLPILDRSGVVRWMGRDGDTITWGDSREELLAKGVEHPKSVTFIPAKIQDNIAGLARDPEYMGNLKALPLLEREQLLMGNWKIRPVGGMFFRRHWFKIVHAAPAQGRVARYWDRAATEKTNKSPNPDWTCGLKGIRHGNRITILDRIYFRGTPDAVLEAIKQASIQDGPDCEQWLEEDPGQAGKSERAMYYRDMADVPLRFLRPVGSKAKRALPASAQAEAGNIDILAGPWNDTYLQEMEAFADWDHVPKDERPTVLPHDDQVDATSGLSYVLLTGGSPSIA